MLIIDQRCEWEQKPPWDALQIIERAGRTCYKSEDKITDDSSLEFVKKLLGRGHLSVLEHVSASMRFITDRGVTHEMVRHRLASYSQESTRYCNYGRGACLVFIRPVWVENPIQGEIPASLEWCDQMHKAEFSYLSLLKKGWSPQQARTVLPNSLKTEIVMTANLREWRHFFQLRCAPAAHPQMRDLACKALAMFQEAVPVVFDDLGGMA